MANLEQTQSILEMPASRNPSACGARFLGLLSAPAGCALVLYGSEAMSKKL